MSYGYSLKFVELNKAADKNLLGVYFGAVCIKNDVPVTEVAQKLNVSRQAVYNWFVGISIPKPSAAEEIQKIIAKLEQ
jgi:hypothetical protein